MFSKYIKQAQFIQKSNHKNSKILTISQSIEKLRANPLKYSQENIAAKWKTVEVIKKRMLLLYIYVNKL